jgi:CubicO group peptidase (beta-lactamase class C family)
MDIKQIDETMQTYVSNQEMAGGALFVRQGENILYREKWGEVEFDSIYRMMSMTKCITAVAVMICVERGLIGLDEPLSTYIPEFKEMKVMDDERYVFEPKKLKKLPLMLLTFRMDKVKNKPAQREITIRDLLSHSSGLQQGLVGLLAMIKEKEQYKSLRDYVLHYTKHCLDFEPGTGTGYSPLAGFDILGYVVSVVSGMSLDEFIQKEICAPLNMKNTTFFLSDEQKPHLVDVYKRKKNRLIKVTGTKNDMAGFMHQKEICFEHGCGGIYSTLDDYSNFGEMLLCKGNFRGVQILKPETVELMHTEAPKQHLEPEPGFVWGLGMKIRQDSKKANVPATEGTYGWSGAFGTHFFISPKDDLEVVFMMNRSDIGGSGSYISAKVEEMIFSIWGKEVRDE